MRNRNICSIHNHVKGTYSAPSAANFEILNHEFEKYEIICADEEYWIVEAKDNYENEFIENLKKDIKYEFDKCDLGIYQNNSDEIYNSNEEYSKRLSELINNSNNNILLKRKEYR